MVRLTMKKLAGVVGLALVGLLVACDAEVRPDYTDGDVPAPSPVTDIVVTPRSGSIILKYRLPLDPSLSYVKAEYEIRPGVKREGKASIYVDTLELAGFGDTRAYDIHIFSVGKNGKASVPQTIRVSPLEPPVISVFNTVDLVRTFGGVNVAFDNVHRANLALVVLVDTTGNDDWTVVNTFYTAAERGSFSARNQPPVARRFAVFVRDRWDNKSDTLIQTLTPFYEEFLSKDQMTTHKLQTDADWLPQYPPSMVIDGTFNQGENIYASVNDAGLPQSLTLNFGRDVVLSRFKLYQRGGANRVYTANVPKTFEVYGSNAPLPDGDWDAWDYIETFQSFKPSGLPFGSVDPIDVQYGSVDGEDFEFSVPVPPYRYIRFKFTETYGMIGQVVISELSFWGQEID